MTDNHPPVAAYYDMAAEQWDATHAGKQNPLFARRLTESLAALLAPSRGHALAVELGAGTGPYIGITAPMFRRLICTDISAGMLAVLERRRQTLGLSNVEVLQQDASVLRAIADASADVVYSVGLFETVADPVHIFAAARRVLKRSGIFASITSNGDCPWYALRKRLERGERPGHIVRFMAPEEVRTLAGQTGFNISDIECWGLLPPGISNPVLARFLDLAGNAIGATPFRRYLGVLAFRLKAR